MNKDAKLLHTSNSNPGLPNNDKNLLTNLNSPQKYKPDFCK